MVEVQPPNQPPPPAVPPPTGLPPAPAAPAPGQAKPRNSRLRLFLAMGAGLMALLCLGGVGVAISLYDDATKIERSAPDGVLDGFLGAYLVNRDDEQASLYMCESGGDFSKIAAYRADIVGREKRYSIGIQAAWKGMDVTVDGKSATVETDLIKTIADGSEDTSDRWQFYLSDDDGWRVCGAKQVP